MAVGYISKIEAKNVLSFGPEGSSVELGPLNVLIGPNGSGKSNLIDLIRFMAASPTNQAKVLAESGGAAAWPSKRIDEDDRLELSLRVLFYRDWNVEDILNSSLLVVSHWQSHRPDASLSLYNERIISEDDQNEATLVYDGGIQGFIVDYVSKISIPKKELRKHGVDSKNSIVSEIRDLSRYPQIFLLQEFYKSIKYYSDWDCSRRSKLRDPIAADLDASFLEEDGHNLALVLNELMNLPKSKKQITEALQEFCPRIESIASQVRQGTVQTFIHEDGLDKPISINRVSDGTLRFLCLLAILCHPEPPRVVCLEEPELGLHPDMMFTLAGLLIQASERCQLIVTTHSDLLVSALSSKPESIIVTEHDGVTTKFRHLDSAQVDRWLETKSLGDLWLSGQIGGTRY